MFGRSSNRVLDWVAGSYDASTATLHRCAHVCVSAPSTQAHASHIKRICHQRERGRASGIRKVGGRAKLGYEDEEKRGDKEEEAYLDEDGREHSGRFVLREESRKRG